jgi:hypothetical protein
MQCDGQTMRTDLEQAVLEWCRRERDVNQRLIDQISAGSMRTGKNDGSGWQDTSDEDLARAQKSVADMDELIARIEANSG